MILGYLLAGAAGAALGALVNWLADLLPRRRAARTEPAGLDETPVGAGRVGRIARLVLVELVLIAAALFLWWREGLSPLLVILLFYLTVFVLVAVIDIEHRLILNVVMLPAFAFALPEVLLSGRIRPLDALAGYAVAQIAVMAFFLLGEVYLWFVNRRRETPVDEVAFGFGDVTLATFCGLVLGFPRAVPMLLLMVLFGALFALIYLLGRLVIARRYQAYAALPYGPAILLAATLLLLWGPQIARLMGAD